MWVRVAAGGAAAAVLLVACGGGGNASSCAAVADQAKDFIQDILDDVSSIPLEDLTSGSAIDDALDTDITARGRQLEAAASDLGCSDEEMGRLVSERLVDLEADGAVGELLLGFLRQAAEQGEFGFDLGGDPSPS